MSSPEIPSLRPDDATRRSPSKPLPRTPRQQAADEAAKQALGAREGVQKPLPTPPIVKSSKESMLVQQVAQRVLPQGPSQLPRRSPSPAERSPSPETTSFSEIRARVAAGFQKKLAAKTETFESAMKRLTETIFGIVNISKDPAERTAAKKAAFENLQRADMQRVGRGIRQGVMHAGGKDAVLPKDFAPMLLGMFESAVRLAGTEQEIASVQELFTTAKESKNLSPDADTKKRIKDVDKLINDRQKEIGRLTEFSRNFDSKIQKAETEKEIDDIQRDFVEAKNKLPQNADSKQMIDDMTTFIENRRNRIRLLRDNPIELLNELRMKAEEAGTRGEIESVEESYLREIKDFPQDARTSGAIMKLGKIIGQQKRKILGSKPLPIRQPPPLPLSEAPPLPPQDPE